MRFQITQLEYLMPSEAAMHGSIICCTSCFPAKQLSVWVGRRWIIQACKQKRRDFIHRGSNKTVKIFSFLPSTLLVCPIQRSLEKTRSKKTFFWKVLFITLCHVPTAFAYYLANELYEWTMRKINERLPHRDNISFSTSSSYLLERHPVELRCCQTKVRSLKDVKSRTFLKKIGKWIEVRCKLASL